MSALCIKKDTSALPILTQHISSIDVGVYETLSAALKPYLSIHCLVDSIPPCPEQPTRYAKNIAQFVADNTQIDRLIYLSTTGVFGRDDGTVVDELTPPNPTTPTAKARYEVECCYRELQKELAKKSRNIQVCILRIPAIYGPMRGIGLSLQKGSYRMIGDGEQWTNRIHVVDLASLIAKLVKSGNKLPESIAVSDGTPASLKEVVHYYCNKFALPFPSTVSRQEAIIQGAWSMLANQRVTSRYLKDILPLDEICYPSYIAGAGSEFSRD